MAQLLTPAKSERELLCCLNTVEKCRFNYTNAQKKQVKIPPEDTANKYSIFCQATRGRQIQAQRSSQQGKHMLAWQLRQRRERNGDQTKS